MQKTLKILMIEDNVSNAKLMRDILVYLGYTVLEAGDGKDGIAQAKAKKPDLIIMDVQMPVMDGLTAISAIRADEDEIVSRIPIICVTSDSMRATRDKVFKAGGNDYLTKPIDISEFGEKVKKYLN